MSMEENKEKKTRSGRVVKKLKQVYEQNLVMNNQACSKYKAKMKVKEDTKERVKKHRMANAKKPKSSDKTRKKFKLKINIGKDKKK